MQIIADAGDAQAGENAIHAVVTAVGFTGFRRATETQVQPGLRSPTIAIGITRPEPASSGAHGLSGRRETVSRNRGGRAMLQTVGAAEEKRNSFLQCSADTNHHMLIFF